MDFWSVGEQHVWQILKPAQNMEEKAKEKKRRGVDGCEWHKSHHHMISLLLLFCVYNNFQVNVPASVGLSYRDCNKD